MATAEPADTPREAATREKYTPPVVRHGSALCLSGGGYRAALFHLGVCRRLNEFGRLAEFDAISSVSGGSIFAAHLARQIIQHGGACFNDYETLIAIPFREFAQVDIRSSPAITEWLPWEWAHSNAAADRLAGEYKTHLFKNDDILLSQLPDKPRFIFCATDLAFGVNWLFSKGKVGDYQAGYMAPAQADAQPLERAVATSSCFPPVYRPLPMNLQPGDLTGGMAPQSADRDATVRALALSDGGVYDNLGLEPVWKEYQTLFVSDGGKPFRFSTSHDTPQQLLRMQDVIQNQVEALRKRWLISGYLRGDFDGAYLGIHNSVTDYPIHATAGYSKEFATEVISTIRTDMDSFSTDEMAVLENHGYTLADAAYHSHMTGPPMAAPLEAINNNAAWPDPNRPRAPLEATLRTALKDSATFRLLGH